jgi:hypothetical protein
MKIKLRQPRFEATLATLVGVIGGAVRAIVVTIKKAVTSFKGK